jgi:beta-glucosidase
MTLEEKVSQMMHMAPAIERLRIPAYNWWNEALHGVARAGYATVFPQATGLAATWDMDLVHRVADIISTEARAKYNDAVAHGKHEQYYGLTFWSPNINIFRDPRWGRGQETYGEDPYLTARLGVAFVTGMQGDNPKYLKTVATPKHYAVHSGPEILRHRFDVPISRHDFADTYVPAFRATVVEGKAESVMCAYNSVLGQPACANDLLFSTLRGKWHFNGYVVSDCGAVTDIYAGQLYVMTIERAAALALKAGTDLSCGDEYSYLIAAVRNRLVSEDEIDRAVKRLFIARFRLGLFDSPESVSYANVPANENDTEAHRLVALESARESIVLLKNDGTLPMKSVRHIAVIGPNADSSDVLLGNYNGTPSKAVTPLQGIIRRFNKEATVSYAPGSLLTETSSLSLPSSVLRTPDGKTGVRAEYFCNEGATGEPELRRVESAISMDAQVPTGLKCDDTTFSVTWTGKLVPERSGNHRISASAGDTRVYLDGHLLLDDSTHNGPSPASIPVMLEAGHEYQLKVEHAQHSSGARFSLEWAPPGLVSEAVNVAKSADVVIAVVGISPALEGEEMDVSSPGFFGGDRTDLELPRAQLEMLNAVAATKKPMVVILTNGSALSINWAQEHANAIVEAWYPGEEGGTAIADVLTGDYSPAGRLPVTFYRSVQQLPPMTGRTYRYLHEKPLYAFGYGLSYSTFTYSGLKLSSASISAGEPLQVEATVQNQGAANSDEVVELYLDRQASSPAMPFRSLQGFRRIHLRAGESRQVKFTLNARQLAWANAGGALVVEPGQYTISVGGQQPGPETHVLQRQFTITGKSVVDEPLF